MLPQRQAADMAWGPRVAVALLGAAAGAPSLRGRARRTADACGALVPIAADECPESHYWSYSKLLTCDIGFCGDLCNGGGTCGTDLGLNNCDHIGGVMNFDIYRKYCGTLPPTPPPTPRPTEAPTPSPTPQPTMKNFMTDSRIRTAVAAWLADAAAAEAAYGHISTWETSAVTDMSYLFCGYSYCSCSNCWCSDCDSAAASFNEDIGAWDTSGVTSTYRMFYRASAFNRDIGNWAVDSVKDMDTMFYEAKAFNQDIGGWQVDSVTSMRSMFGSAPAFDQDLGWCVDDGVDLDRAFGGAACASTSCGVTQVDDLDNCPTPSPTKSPTTLAPTTSPAPTAAPTTAAPSISPAPTAAPTSWEDRLNALREEILEQNRPGIGMVLAVVTCLVCSVCVLLAVSFCFVGSARFAKRKTTPGAAPPTALPKPVPSAPPAPVPTAPPPPPQKHSCRNCGAIFRSKNALFRHLRDERCGQVPRATAPPPPPPPSAFLVTCPHGAGPGSHLRVRAPTTGQEMTVIVPRGTRAGGRFAVPLPSGPRPPARAIPTK